MKQNITLSILLSTITVAANPSINSQDGILTNSANPADVIFPCNI